MKFANHAEGYIEPDGAGGYDYVYQYTDHLGNIRLSYSDSNADGAVDNSEIISEKNYYPFGLTHMGYNNQFQGIYHPYGFGGKEEQVELELEWLDFSARNYDVTLGRWMNIDPLAKDYSSTSPYVYTLNNPLFFIDPDGKKIRNADEERKKKAEEQVKKHQEIVKNAESLYGTKKVDFKNKTQYKRYKQAKKNLKKANKNVKKYTALAKATQKRINEFKKNSPKMFAAMDNIKNEYNEEVDVMVSTESLLDNNGQNEFSYIEDSDNEEIRVSTNEFGINTLAIKIDPVMQKSYRGTIPTTLETMKHEMGHANYTIRNTHDYYLYYLEHLKSFRAGHRKDDKSGQRAEEWEDKEDLQK